MRKKAVKKLLHKVVEDYDNIAEEFHTTRQHDWKEFEYSLPYIRDNQIILDLGCGNGRFFNFLKKKHQVKYLGIDKSVKLIEKAIDAHPEKEAKFVDGDLLNLPVDNDFADLAVLFASLHHIPSKDLRQQAVNQLHRVLKRHGIAVITVWNLFQPKYKKYIYKAWLRFFYTLGKYDPYDTFIPWGNSGVKRYYYAFKPVELRKLLIENGFQILEEKMDNNIMFICQKI